jgi:hypothetical protein
LGGEGVSSLGVIEVWKVVCAIFGGLDVVETPRKWLQVWDFIHVYVLEKMFQFTFDLFLIFFILFFFLSKFSCEIMNRGKMIGGKSSILVGFYSV